MLTFVFNSLPDHVAFAEGKTGVFKDKLGRSYRLDKGKRVPLNAGSPSKASKSPAKTSSKAVTQKPPKPPAVVKTFKAVAKSKPSVVDLRKEFDKGGKLSGLSKAQLKDIIAHHVGRKRATPVKSATKSATTSATKPEAKDDDIETFPIGDPVAARPNVYKALGIKDANVSKEKEQFQKVSLPKIRFFEKKTGKPWIEMLLHAMDTGIDKIDHSTPYQERWDKLVAGDVPGIDKKLKDKNFAHDYGSMSLPNLKKVVKLLNDAGYQPGKKNTGDSKGKISEIADEKMKKAFGFAPSHHDFSESPMPAFTIFFGGTSFVCFAEGWVGFRTRTGKLGAYNQRLQKKAYGKKAESLLKSRPEPKTNKSYSNRKKELSAADFKQAKKGLEWYKQSAHRGELDERLATHAKRVNVGSWRQKAADLGIKQKFRKKDDLIKAIRDHLAANLPEDPAKAEDERILVARPELTDYAPPELVMPSAAQHLRPHQLKGSANAIRALDDHGIFLLSDGTGVGKTREQLAVAATQASKGKKVLIISKAEVIKPDWRKKSMAGSFDADSKAMGIDLKLSNGSEPLEKGQIQLTTYNNLAKFKDKIDKDTCIIFDESHSVKNWESSRARDADDLAKAAGQTMFASATPADRPMDLVYIFRNKLFGADKGWDEIKKELGVIERQAGKHETMQVDPSVGAPECFRRLSEIFDKLTKEGMMLKREIKLDGVEMATNKIALPPEAQAELADIQAKGGNGDTYLMHARRAQERYKIPHTVDYVQKELAAGRSVVVFASLVNDTTDPGSGRKIPGTMPLLKQALKNSGIEDIAELHGGAEGSAKNAMDDFQSGKARVIIATPESGGTGVNLDDTTGERPRSMLIMTPPFDAITTMQLIGRIHRLNTKSNSRVNFLFADSKVDDWNTRLLRNKMQSLKAIVKGESDKVKFSEKKPKAKQAGFFMMFGEEGMDYQSFAEWFMKIGPRGGKIYVNSQTGKERRTPPPQGGKRSGPTLKTATAQAKTIAPKMPAKKSTVKPAAKRKNAKDSGILKQDKTPKKPAVKMTFGKSSPRKQESKPSKEAAQEAFSSGGTAESIYSALKKSNQDLTLGQFQDYARELLNAGIIRPKLHDGYNHRIRGEQFGISTKDGDPAVGYELVPGKTLPPLNAYKKNDKLPNKIKSAVANLGSHGSVALPDLFDEIKKENRNLTIGQFHDAIRDLASKGVIRSNAYTRPLATVKRPELGYPDEMELKYYVAPGDTKSAKPIKESSGNIVDPKQFASEKMGVHIRTPQDDSLASRIESLADADTRVLDANYDDWGLHHNEALRYLGNVYGELKRSAQGSAPMSKDRMKQKLSGPKENIQAVVDAAKKHGRPDVAEFYQRFGMQAVNEVEKEFGLHSQETATPSAFEVVKKPR